MTNISCGVQANSTFQREREGERGRDGGNENERWEGERGMWRERRRKQTLNHYTISATTTNEEEEEQEEQE